MNRPLSMKLRVRPGCAVSGRLWRRRRRPRHRGEQIRARCSSLKLRRKFGNEVTYGDDSDHSSHLKTEFGFDVLQVARGHYPPKAYHDFDRASQGLQRPARPRLPEDLRAPFERRLRGARPVAWNLSVLRQHHDSERNGSGMEAEAERGFCKMSLRRAASSSSTTSGKSTTPKNGVPNTSGPVSV